MTPRRPELDGTVSSAVLALGWLAALSWWIAPEWPPTGSKPGLLLTPLWAGAMAVAPPRAAPVCGAAAMLSMSGILLWRMLARLPWWHAGAHLLGAAVLGGLAAVALARVQPGRRLSVPLVCAVAGATLLTTNSVLFGVLGFTLALLTGVVSTVTRGDSIDRLHLAVLPCLGALLLDGIWVSNLPMTSAVLFVGAIGVVSLEGWKGPLSAAVLSACALAWGIALEGLPTDL